MSILDLFREVKVSVDASAKEKCNVCQKVDARMALATCPKCQRRYCPLCAPSDDLIVYQPSDRAGAATITCGVFRCPMDNELLKKPNRESYIEHLRELEGEDWSRRLLDPSGALPEPYWNPASVNLARRFLAIGMTYLPNLIMTFGLLGAITSRLSHGNDMYLEDCTRDFGGDQFPLAIAQRLLPGFAEACFFGLKTDNKEVWMAIVMGFSVARQFLRYKGGCSDGIMRSSAVHALQMYTAKSGFSV